MNVYSQDQTFSCVCVRAVWCAYLYCTPDSRNHRIRMVDCGGPCVEKVYTVDLEFTLQVGKYRLSVCIHFYMYVNFSKRGHMDRKRRRAVVLIILLPT